MRDQLLQLARQANVELLFDRKLTAGLQSPSLNGRYTPEAAIQQLLRGTDLKVRRSDFGAFIIEAGQTAPLARQDVTVPEVLVVGRRSQNADIRRAETDIQPYRVATGAQVVGSDRDNLDQFFRSRVPANAAVLPPSLDVKGETGSEIDLRGLGPGGTLVLIDGRRMPSIPATIFGFRQPDLNALPLQALDRVEILTGTSGGIHGFGALGGAVNVILDRRPEGAKLYASGAITSRGDARQFEFGGRIGFTLGEGSTDVSLHASASRAEPLLTGERPYIVRDTARTADLARDTLLGLRSNGNSVTVLGSGGAPLTFKPEYGGATIGSFYSYLPGGLTGEPAEVAAMLTQNAGKFDNGLTNGDAASAIGSTPRTEALLANVRHRLDSGAEIYVDAVMLWNRGSYVGHQTDATEFLPANSPYNPFTRQISIAYPVDGLSVERTVSLESARYLAGVVTPLPFEWRATGEISIGEARYETTQATVDQSMLSTVSPAPAPNPFGDWEKFQDDLAAYRQRTYTDQSITNRYSNVSVRLAGPVFETAAGTSTLTLLAERRVEDVPSYQILTAVGASAYTTTIAARTSTTTSYYGELRSRVFDDAAQVGLARGLELQLALRNDTETDDFARDPRATAGERMRARFSGVTYTLGAKASPTSWLTLRTSYATGQTPPPLGSLIEAGGLSNIKRADDPKRGGINGRITSLYLYRTGGSADLETIEASTASIGAILSPFGQAGPRLTFDYSRIRTSGDIFTPTNQEVLNHEDDWPERVVRGPLSDDDRARGYTAGPLTLLDVRPVNGAGLLIDTVDAHFDWQASLGDGRLRLYGDATYYLRQVKTAPFRDDVENAGYFGRPLQRRANIGAEWSAGPVTLGANLQHFGGYRIYPPGLFDYVIETTVDVQGASRVPAQTYLDLHASWRKRLDLGGSGQDLQIDLGVVNVFDQAPPRESSYGIAQFNGTAIPTPGYSRYGDPRQRRFLLTISTAF